MFFCVFCSVTRIRSAAAMFRADFRLLFFILMNWIIINLYKIPIISIAFFGSFFCVHIFSIRTDLQHLNFRLNGQQIEFQIRVFLLFLSCQAELESVRLIVHWKSSVYDRNSKRRRDKKKRQNFNVTNWSDIIFVRQFFFVSRIFSLFFSSFISVWRRCWWDFAASRFNDIVLLMSHNFIEVVRSFSFFFLFFVFLPLLNFFFWFQVLFVVLFLSLASLHIA